MGKKHEEKDLIAPENRQQWRDWLETNHAHLNFVWVIYHTQRSALPTITVNEAVDEALCYGWINGTARPIDQNKYKQYFCKRKPNSTWSKINKEKVDNLVATGQMKPAGVNSIELAKSNGSWSILDDVEEFIIPDDLKFAFGDKTTAWQFFSKLSKSVTKAILQWLVFAKKEETRIKRIKEIVHFSEERNVPKQFRP